jgi:acyl-CoA reductase-like NAD-dependent aldehyde dehydrogenase
MEEYKIFCAGEFITTEKKLEVTNKFENTAFAYTYLADQAILNRAILAAEKAREACAGLSSLEKFTALRFISAELEKNKQRLGELLCMESGKPIKSAIAEIERSVQTFLVAAEESKRLPGEYVSLDWTANGRNKEGIVKYFPVGIVGGIAPFNFPMNLAVHKIAPAIATGCPIILKPASTTPLSTLELAKIIAQTKLPKGAVSILPMDRKTGNNIATDERIALLSFTGSPPIGWELKKQSGKKKVVLELGGNAGVIVSDSANLEELVTKSLVGGFSYSGQICIHAQRFFVHEAIFDAFASAFVAKTKSLKFGDPLKPDTDVSVMIDEENARRVEEWIAEAVKAGATVLCGGKRNDRFVEPCVLTGTSNTMKVYAEEVFGPVICLEKYNGDIEEAVNKVNDTKFGLQCGVFTNKISELDYCFKHLEVGGVIHNEMPTLRFDQMPYGGIKESGLGREGVKYAMADMLEAKILVK